MRLVRSHSSLCDELDPRSLLALRQLCATPYECVRDYLGRLVASSPVQNPRVVLAQCVASSREQTTFYRAVLNNRVASSRKQTTVYPG